LSILAQHRQLADLTDRGGRFERADADFWVRVRGDRISARHPQAEPS
jgi:hypothetical protein